MTGSPHRWARPARDGGVVVGYALLMIIAIRSVRHDADGLRVLWPAVVMALPAVLLRRRPPVTLALMTAGASAVILALGPGDVTFGPRLAVAAAAGAVAARSRLPVGVGSAAAAGATLAGAEIVARAGYEGSSVAVAVHATQIGFLAVLIAAAVLTGLLIRQRREHAEAAQAQATAQAIIGERLRIARELHDSVAHSIGIIALQAGAAHQVFDTQPVRARQAIGVVETASREALAELRRMLGGLRAGDLVSDAEHVPAGLSDLPRLASVTGAAGVRVDVRWLGTPAPLPPEIDRSAFRIIQEAVTNVVRHAGVDSCRVTVEHADGALAVEVLDDGRGRGAGTHGTGHGLVGIRERVALLNGDFAAGPRAEGGYRVTARLPTPVPAA